MRVGRSLSLRAKILILVLAVGLAPLTVLGYWFSERTASTGETVLRERLREGLHEQRGSIEQEWVLYRSRLLDLADLDAVAAPLSRGTIDGPPPPELRQAFGRMDISLASIRIQARQGEWRLDRGAGTPSAFGLPLRVQLPIHDRLSGDSLGILEAAVNINALRPRATTPVAGAVLTAVDPATGAVLIPVGIDRSALNRPRFRWNDEPWVAEDVGTVAPPVRLIAAAPLGPFASPFEDAARRGVLLLTGVVLAGLALAWALSRRLTISLQRLADSASAVAAGDLFRRVPVHSDDEVGRVGMAFNTMTDNLKRTLEQLAERESLAAVNEFAAALAHEVRNPLTSIQLDLQEVEENLDPQSRLRTLQKQALQDLGRLDRTVAGALETARSGRVEPRSTDVGRVLRNAARAARPAFDRRSATLYLQLPDDPLVVMGDPDALERVFLNLFLNAAEASTEGGRATLEAGRAGSDPGEIHIRLSDEGPGIPTDRAADIFEPFFTTRPGGTGLGLAVARRIITAHRGTIELVETSGRGATFRVVLPSG